MRRTPAGGGQALIAHPDTPARAVAGVYYTHLWRNPGEWQFNFHVAAPPSVLRLPSPAEPARADGLWQHTCFEAFIRDPSSGAYLEFNFSPSGQWAAYQFDGYRAGMRELVVSTPDISSSNAAQTRMAFSARMRRLGLDTDSIAGLTALPEMPVDPSSYWLSVNFAHPGLWKGIACQVGLSAVIEEGDGTRSYWALRHAPGKPDFHDAGAFLLEFPGPQRR